MKNIKSLNAIIGMLALLITSFNVNAETIPGCNCQTTGFSTTTGQSCAKNICEPKVKITSVIPAVLIDGRGYTIKWDASNVPADAVVGIKLVAPYGQPWWSYTILSEYENAPAMGSFRFIPRVLGERTERYRVVVSVYLPGRDQYGDKIKIAEVASKVKTIHLRGKKRSLDIVSPVKGGAYFAANPLVVSWNSVNLPAGAKIQLNAWSTEPSEDGKKSYFYQTVSNTGSYQWNIPGDFIPGKYVFSITSPNEYGYNFAEDSVYFSVYQPPVVVILEE